MHKEEAELIASALKQDNPDADIKAEEVPNAKPTRWRVIAPGLELQWGFQFVEIRLMGLAQMVQQQLAAAQNPVRAQALAKIVLPGQ